MFTLLVRPLMAAGFAVVVLAFASPSMAAVPAVEATPSYEDLIARLDALPSMLEADAVYDAAAARAQQARALPNPSIVYDRENVYGTGPYNGTGNAESTLSINQPLELFGQRSARIQAARSEADAAGLRREQARWQIAGRLALAYAEAEAAARRHDLAAEALSLTEQDARGVAAMVEQGREATLRGVQAQSEVEAARAALDEARALRDGAFARLSAIALLDRPVQAIGASLLDRTPALPGARSDDPLAVQVATAELDAASRLVTVERRRALPDVSAGVGMRRFRDTGDEAFTVGVELTVPLFDRDQPAGGVEFGFGDLHRQRVVIPGSGLSQRTVEQARADGLDRPIEHGDRRQPCERAVAKGLGFIDRRPGGLDLAPGLDVPQGGFAPLLDHRGDPARILLGQRKRLGREVVAPCPRFGLGVGQRQPTRDQPAGLFASQVRNVRFGARGLDPGAALAEQFERLVDRQGRFGVADAAVRTGAIDVLPVVRDRGVGQGPRLLGARSGRVVNSNGFERRRQRVETGDQIFIRWGGLGYRFDRHRGRRECQGSHREPDGHERPDTLREHGNSRSNSDVGTRRDGHGTSALRRSHGSFGQPECATGVLRCRLHVMHGAIPHSRAEKEVGRRMVAMVVGTRGMRAVRNVALAGFVLRR